VVSLGGTLIPKYVAPYGIMGRKRYLLRYNTVLTGKHGVGALGLGIEKNPDFHGILGRGGINQGVGEYQGGGGKGC